MQKYKRNHATKPRQEKTDEGKKQYYNSYPCMVFMNVEFSECSRK